MKTILIVDDKPEICAIIEQFLGDKYNFVTKNNGLEALSWLQEGEIPDLIISDINMPQIDGKELVKQLKSSGYFNEIPIIILSSIENTKEKIELLKLGADDYMVKPFNPEELEIRVEKLIK